MRSRSRWVRLGSSAAARSAASATALRSSRARSLSLVADSPASAPLWAARSCRPAFSAERSTAGSSFLSRLIAHALREGLRRPFTLSAAARSPAARSSLASSFRTGVNSSRGRV